MPDERHSICDDPRAHGDDARGRLDHRRELHRHDRPDGEGVSSAADTITSVRTNLETLETVLRAVNILGLTPLGPPAEAVGGIANAIEGLDTRLTAIADSLDGNRTPSRQRRLARPLGDSIAAMADACGSGVIEDSLADVQLVVAVVLLMFTWRPSRRSGRWSRASGSTRTRTVRRRAADETP